MTTKFNNILISSDHSIFVPDLPYEAGDFVDIMIVKSKTNLVSKINLPLSNYPIEYLEPFEPVIDSSFWEANN